MIGLLPSPYLQQGNFHAEEVLPFIYSVLYVMSYRYLSILSLFYLFNKIEYQPFSQTDCAESCHYYEAPQYIKGIKCKQNGDIYYIYIYILWKIPCRHNLQGVKTFIRLQFLGLVLSNLNHRWSYLNCSWCKLQQSCVKKAMRNQQNKYKIKALTSHNPAFR